MWFWFSNFQCSNLLVLIIYRQAFCALIFQCRLFATLIWNTWRKVAFCFGLWRYSFQKASKCCLLEKEVECFDLYELDEEFLIWWGVTYFLCLEFEIVCSVWALAMSNHFHDLCRLLNINEYARFVCVKWMSWFFFKVISIMSSNNHFIYYWF